jgi:hypothetical protein
MLSCSIDLLSDRLLCGFEFSSFYFRSGRIYLMSCTRVLHVSSWKLTTVVPDSLPCVQRSVRHDLVGRSSRDVPWSVICFLLCLSGHHCLFSSSDMPPIPYTVPPIKAMSSNFDSLHGISSLLTTNEEDFIRNRAIGVTLVSVSPHVLLSNAHYSVLIRWTWLI